MIADLALTIAGRWLAQRAIADTEDGPIASIVCRIEDLLHPIEAAAGRGTCLADTVSAWGVSLPGGGYAIDVVDGEDRSIVRAVTVGGLLVVVSTWDPERRPPPCYVGRVPHDPWNVAALVVHELVASGWRP